jgi:dTDP-glucose 4,6-dehydratase
VLQRGRVGETYNIGGNSEQENISVVRLICELLEELVPRGSQSKRFASLIEFVKDRPGHDARYAIDAGKIEAELGWKPSETFTTGIEKTVRWYLDHRGWWQRVLDGSYRLERIGTGEQVS